MDEKSAVQLILFIASIASLILAVVAISLSIVFYRFSNEAATATTEAAKGIGANVDRLEKLFDKLYSDTFSMMRDTVSDMRKVISELEKVRGEGLVDLMPDSIVPDSQIRLRVPVSSAAELRKMRVRAKSE